MTTTAGTALNRLHIHINKTPEKTPQIHFEKHQLEGYIYVQEKDCWEYSYIYKAYIQQEKSITSFTTKMKCNSPL
jgi:hypothetical protein